MAEFCSWLSEDNNPFSSEQIERYQEYFHKMLM